MATEIQTSDGESDVERSKSKRPRLVTIKIIERQNKAVLVEWLDESLYNRATVPAAKLKGDTCAADTLAAAIPYGVDWLTQFAEFPNAAEIANELRRQNIWTADDFNKKITTVRAVINRLFVIPQVEKMRSIIT